jgi:hypothetical protein
LKIEKHRKIDLRVEIWTHLTKIEHLYYFLVYSVHIYRKFIIDLSLYISHMKKHDRMAGGKNPERKGQT